MATADDLVAWVGDAIPRCKYKRQCWKDAWWVCTARPRPREDMCDFHAQPELTPHDQLWPDSVVLWNINGPRPDE